MQSTELKLAVKYNLNKLADIEPRNMLQYLSNIKPQIQMEMFDALTGYEVSSLHKYLPEEMLLEIGRKLEYESCRDGRKYHLVEPIIEDNTPHDEYSFAEAKLRFIPKGKTAVDIDLRSWDPGVYLKHLKYIDGTTIPVDRYKFAGSRRDSSDVNYCISSSALPGRVHVLKEINFALSPEQYAKGYLASQEITVNSHIESLPEYIVNTTVNDTSELVGISTRMHIHPAFGPKYQYSYKLESLYTSKFFIEALRHFIIYEIQKSKIKRIVEMQNIYTERKAPHYMITALYVLASNNFSYRENEELHALLALSKEFGSIQLIPKGHKSKRCFWSDKAKKVAYTWGFRTEEEMPNIPICVVS
jgi:hypothetical protein